MTTVLGQTYEASISVMARNGMIQIKDINVKTDNDYAAGSFYNAFSLDYPGVV